MGTVNLGASVARPGVGQDKPNSVYRYYDHAGRLIYVGITAQGPGRQRQHNATSEWWQYVASQTVEHCPDRETALRVERALIEAHRPPFNRQHNEPWEDLRAGYLRLISAERAYSALQAGEAIPGGDDGTLNYLLSALLADPRPTSATALARQIVSAAGDLAATSRRMGMPETASMIERIAVPDAEQMAVARAAWARKGA